MHYYKFNIGDYASHTNHLSIEEDLAFRRMLDWHYLHESPLPDNVEQIARLIRMRSHGDSIAIVLQEFFDLGEYGWFQSKAVKEIEQYLAKSEKAKKSAAARWNKRDANALQDECDSNANHKPLTINQEPLNNTSISPTAQSAKADKIPYLKIKDLWNKHCTNLKGVRDLTQKRKTAIKKLWNQKNDAGEYPYRDSAFYIRWFTFCNDDPWYNGTDPNSSGWIADFIFCLKVDNILGKQE